MVTIGSLFTGVAGLDTAVQEVFGGTHAWFSEIDKAASKVLAYRFPGVRNLGDITQIDWAAVEPVDVLCGGFPCQDVSAAGKRAGIKDGTRSGLWAVFAEAIDALQPQYVVIENVRGLLSAAAHRTVEDDAGDYLEPDPAGVGDGTGRPVLRAAGAVLGDLADLGYDAQWATVAAADVGAPHRRERVFIVAEAADAKPEPGRGDAAFCGTCGHEQRLHCDWIGPCTKPCECLGFAAADAQGDGWDEGRAESAGIVGGFDAAVSGDEPGVALLPTPSTHDKTGARSPESIARMGKPFANLNDTVVNELRVERGTKPGEIVGGEDDGAVPVLPADGGGDDTLPIALNGDGVAVDVGGCVDSHNACVPAELAGTKPEPGVALLPTPNADVSRGVRSPEGIAKRIAKGDKQFSLEDAVALLPTPTTQDGANNGGPSQFQRNTLPLNAEVTLLPTPRTSDCFGAGQHGDGGMDLRTTVTLLPTPNAQDGNGGGRYSSKGHQSTLPGEARLLCTPSASDGAGGKTSRSGGRIDEPLLGGQAREMAAAWGKYEPAIRRWEQVTGQPAPPPTEPNKNGNPRLSAAFSEWLMGWPAGWVTDPAIGISRNDQLRCVGNGVVTLQAVAALRYLLAVTA